MGKRFFFVVACAFGCLPVSAQNAKLNYTAHISAGLVGGENGPALQLQAVSGVAYKTWSAGIGAGIDYYHTRTVPLFLDLRKTFSARPKAGFVYASGGYSLPWASRANKESVAYAFVTDSKRGKYAEAGLGFYVPAFQTHRLFLSAGWQVKTFTQSVNTMPWLSVWPPPKEAYRDYDYTLTCFTFKAGFWL